MVFILSALWWVRIRGLWEFSSLVAQRLKRMPAMRETWIWSLGRKDPLEKEMATHSSILAWRIPWTEEPSGLQSTGSLRVGHDWATSLSLSTFLHWRRKWQPTPVFLPGESQGRWAAVYGVTQSQTWLKLLSSSSSCKDDTLLINYSLFFLFSDPLTLSEKLFLYALLETVLSLR